MKNTLILIIVLILIGLGVYLFTKDTRVEVPTDGTEVLDENGNVINKDTENPDNEVVVNEKETVLGTSVEGNAITAYHYGTGDTDLLFVGGIHGGYSWNTTLVAYELMDYLEANPSVIPENIKVTVIPVMNPDGLKTATGSTGRFEPSDVSTSKEVLVAGRFNANNVDLSRNFDCNWQASAVWQSTPVSGGSAVFSEPESIAVRDYVEKNTPEAVVVWYSAEGRVYASSCGGDILPETVTITNLYAKGSGYPASQTFDAYKVTGDFVNWLAKKEIPAISVLLTNHQSVEWTKNKAGFESLLTYYSNK